MQGTMPAFFFAGALQEGLPLQSAKHGEPGILPRLAQYDSHCSLHRFSFSCAVESEGVSANAASAMMKRILPFIVPSPVDRA
jgi:hypothetical protein